MRIAFRTHLVTLTSALVLAGVLALSAPAVVAHHAAAPHYDMAKSISLDGTVTKFEFVNPHSYVYFTVPDADGKPTSWRCELQSRTALQRVGWTVDVFTPGRRITVKGAPARREPNVCALRSFVREDGREVKAGENLANGVNLLASLADKNKAGVRPARLANGQPNLSGDWLHVQGPTGRGDGAGPTRTNYLIGSNGGVEATPAGLAAAKMYDPIYDNPAIKCQAPNIFFALGMNRQVNQITQTDDAVIIKYGYMDLVRTVHLNTIVHPRNLTPSTAGHSIGRWEGDVLVVDTIGFSPNVLVPQSGLMHSAGMHAVERFTVDNAKGTLARTYRAEDPQYLKSPYTGWDEMRVSDEPYAPYNCKELSGANNIRAKK